jgi:hypothetical protein
MSDLHDAIMSLDPPESASDFGDRLDERLDAAYKSGFQAARLAAAEIVSAQPAAPADAAPSVAPEPLTRETLAEIVRSHLTSTYHCVRVWEAWHVGTMTEDDFEPASESDMAEEIADAILAAYPPQAHSVAPEPPDVLCWACGIAINTSQPLPVAPEPVAWRYQDARGHYRYRAYKPGFDVEYAILKPVPLYEAHPPRAPLTEEQIDAMWQAAYQELRDEPRCSFDWFEAGIRALEHAHGIGGK